jgi:hypothetical protein
MKPALARDRLRQVLERWFLTEPLLFSLWSDHRVMVEPVATIRVGGGVIGYNPDFIESLTPAELEAVMRCEAVRILLKHPYSRRLLPPRIAWQASNLTLREHLGALPLPLPTAFEVFGHHDYDRQFYEFYHHRLLEEAPESAGIGDEAGGDGELDSRDGSTVDDDGGSGAGGSGSTPTPETTAANDDAEPRSEPSPDSRVARRPACSTTMRTHPGSGWRTPATGTLTSSSARASTTGSVMPNSTDAGALCRATSG